MSAAYDPNTHRNFLRNRCGLSIQKWDTLWKSLEEFLHRPENVILREGPEIHGAEWDHCLHDFLADVAELYWGPNTDELWNVGADDDAPDRSIIWDFVRDCMLHAQQTHEKETQGYIMTKIDLKGPPYTSKKPIKNLSVKEKPPPPKRPALKTGTVVNSKMPAVTKKKDEKRAQQYIDSSDSEIALLPRAKRPKSQSTLQKAVAVGSTIPTLPSSATPTRSLATVSSESTIPIIQGIADIPIRGSIAITTPKTPVTPVRLPEACLERTPDTANPVIHALRGSSGPTTLPAAQSTNNFIGPSGNGNTTGIVSIMCTVDPEQVTHIEMASATSISPPKAFKNNRSARRVSHVPGYIFNDIVDVPCVPLLETLEADEDSLPMRNSPNEGTFGTVGVGIVESGRPKLTFQTTLPIAFNRPARYVHVPKDLNLAEFVDMLHKKHNLRQHQHVVSLTIKFQDSVIMIEMDHCDRWLDWNSSIGLYADEGKFAYVHALIR